jgi:hypothetical protein
MNRIFYFNGLFVNKIFVLETSLLSSPYNLNIVDKGIVHSTISNTSFEKNVSFTKVLWILEHFTIQKSFSKNYITRRVGRNEKQTIFSSSVTLRKTKLFDLCNFFTFFILRNFRRKLLKMPRKLSPNGNFFFLIKDVSVVPGYVESFFKWPYFLFFQLKFLRLNKYPLSRASSKILNKYFLQELGFKVK